MWRRRATVACVLLLAAAGVASAQRPRPAARGHGRARGGARVAGSPRPGRALGVTAPVGAVVPQPRAAAVGPAAAVVEEEEAAGPAAILTTRDGKRILCSAVEESGLWLV